MPSRAPQPGQQEALQKLEILKQEAAKGNKADHGLMTRLAEGIVGLVPEALKSLARAFGASAGASKPGFGLLGW
jgi:hypothetical protein